MSRQTAEQAFKIESGDQQRAEIASGGGKFVQSHHKQEVEGNRSAWAQFRQFESAAAQGTVGWTEFFCGVISKRQVMRLLCVKVIRI